MLSLLWQIYDIIGLIFIVANGQILKNNLTIWSHWSEAKVKVWSSYSSSNSWKTEWPENEIKKFEATDVVGFLSKCTQEGEDETYLLH